MIVCKSVFAQNSLKSWRRIGIKEVGDSIFHDENDFWVVFFSIERLFHTPILLEKKVAV